MQSKPILFKRTSTGAIQVWWQDIDGDKFRSNSGQHNGAIVTSEWTVCQPKNWGKINETTGEEQAEKEVQSNYTKKLAQGGYSDSIDDLEHKFFHPMLAKNYNDYVPSFADFSNGWVYCQPKLDGVRCIATKDGLWTRTGKRIVTCPHIWSCLENVFDKLPNLVLDGELYNHELKHDFNEIVSIVRKTKPDYNDFKKAISLIQYHIYDCSAPPFTGEEFDVRSIAITDLFRKIPDLNDNGYFVKVRTNNPENQEQLDQLYEQYLNDGYEGQMVRYGNSPYENKRSKYLLKRKEFNDTEFPILDVCEGIGNRSGLTGYMVLSLPDGRTFRANVKGERSYLRQLLERRKEIIGSLATVEHFKLTPDGIPRFPRVSKIHEGEKI